MLDLKYDLGKAVISERAGISYSDGNEGSLRCIRWCKTYILDAEV